MAVMRVVVRREHEQDRACHAAVYVVGHDTLKNGALEDAVELASVHWKRKLKHGTAFCLTLEIGLYLLCFEDFARQSFVWNTLRYLTHLSGAKQET